MNDRRPEGARQIIAAGADRHRDTPATIPPLGCIRHQWGKATPGANADITLFDTDREWVFERRDTASKSQNNPFYGWTLKGKPTATIVAGKIVWRE